MRWHCMPPQCRLPQNSGGRWWNDLPAVLTWTPSNLWDHLRCADWARRTSTIKVDQQYETRRCQAIDSLQILCVLHLFMGKKTFNSCVANQKHRPFLILFCVSCDAVLKKSDWWCGGDVCSLFKYGKRNCSSDVFHVHTGTDAEWWLLITSRFLLVSLQVDAKFYILPSQKTNLCQVFDINRISQSDVDFLRNRVGL